MVQGLLRCAVLCLRYCSSRCSTITSYVNQHETDGKIKLFFIGTKQFEDKSVMPVTIEEIRRSSPSRKLPRMSCEWGETKARNTLYLLKVSHDARSLLTTQRRPRLCTISIFIRMCFHAFGFYMQVLGALQVLGRGNCFADVASFSLMSRTTAEKSFHRFCDCFSAGLWHQWVRLPEGDDLKHVESIYSDLGFPGAVGSTDCTHVAWERCPFSETNNHKGKEGYTSVAFEVTCDHTGRILASTKGYPGAENDKTIIKRDLSVRRIRDDDPWASYKYELRGLDGTVTEHTGGWLIVDGGYQRVSERHLSVKEVG